jgi:hypothetical protein
MAGRVTVEGAGPGVAAIQRLNLGFSAAAVAAGWALVSPVFASSVALGAAVELWNFRALHRGALRLFSGMATGSGLAAAGFGLRFLFLALAIALALRSGAHPIGLALGLSMIVPATLIGAWIARPRGLAASDLAVPPPDDPSWDRWNAWRAAEREEDPEEDR